VIKRRPWKEELDIIDRTMKAISSITDPEQLVEEYWDGVGELLDVQNYLAVSRRNVEPPGYLITRSSRFTEHFNPWTQRERLPKLQGGLLGEIAYANAPVIIEDLPRRLKRDDPAHFYLEGYGSLVALPTYDGGESINVTCSLWPPGAQIDLSMIPMMLWQTNLFGRGTTNLVLRNQLSTALAALDRELQVVGAIQRSLLPSELPTIDGFELAAHYETSARAGGDYYDFFPLDGGRWGLFIADVSGHGTPAAVLMAVTHAIAHSQPGKHTPPETLLDHLNRQLCHVYTRDGTFVTAFYGVLDPAKGTLTYASAGHNPPRLVRKDEVLSLSEDGGLPMGIDVDEAYGQSTITLERGDLLLLYTDGITEARGMPDSSGSRELFGTQRLDQVLLDVGGGSLERCLNHLRRGVSEFCSNAPQADDQTLIAIRVR
jgi:sigma-B regulation protein RsbU (phosphoserine phosphatase)